MYKVFKSFTDFIFSVMALYILFPFLVCIYLVLWISLKENPLFVQLRIGKNEKVFDLYKFKTLKDELTPNNFCLFLRKSGLDELPQLLNILKFEMSFVGPRPLLPEYLALYSAEQKRRHHVLPGITGLVQVKGGNSLSWYKRFDLDLKYVDKHSFLLDSRILLETLLLAFKSGKGQHYSEKFEGNANK